MSSSAGWHVAGASVQGISHQKGGTPCQDSHAWRHLGDGLLVAAVADGAGSSASSDIGSFLAAQTAVAKAAERLQGGVPSTEKDWQALLREAVHAARYRIVEVADILGLPSVELATTLLIAVVTRDQVAAGQVGDGAIVAQLAADRLCSITRPPPQEYLNETTFVTSPAFLDRAQFVICPGPVSGLALLTDGLQMLALQMPQGQPHAPFFAPLLRLLAATAEDGQASAQLKGFLQSPRITGRADDDLTLVLAVQDGTAKT